MNDNTKTVFGIIFFLIVCWGIAGVLNGKSFFEPTLEIIDEMGNTFSNIIKIVLFIGIIWFVFALIKKKK